MIFGGTKVRRNKAGVVIAMFGGYVTHDTRNGDRREIEVRVWLPAHIDEVDCGTGTERVIRALCAKVRKKGKTNVGCRECWRY